MYASITKDHILNLLEVFVAAIELDQIRVDALPEGAFDYHYSDSMWRLWRRCHLEYLRLLLSTVDTVLPAVLEKLGWIATHYEPKLVRERLRDLLGSAASGDAPREDVATAALFFERLIQDISGNPEGKSIGQEAWTSMMQWLPITDPLQIADDPECGYRLGVHAFS
ncbi:hypothetical protein [Bradyrhizobium sp.]|uniref:hypothetical protein n=1 Tax=Bradyrhizobium sp. TaxID=376 RepID=UPI0007C90D9E|nr:hypothetical protein [Bradyrhizobium sp.]